MKILITGAAGFIGSHVASTFSEHHEVVGLVRLSQVGDLRRFQSCEHNDLRFVYHDLKHPISELLHEQIGALDAVLHIGANSHVDRSISHPKEFFEDNVIGTVNLFEYLRKHHPRVQVINFGTDEVYGPAPVNYAFTETDRYRPSNPYSASKAAQLCVGHSYFTTYGLRCMAVNPTNVYGEGQNFEKFMPLVVKKILAGQAVPIHSKLNSADEVEYVGSRCWLYVKNIPSCLAFLLEKGTAGEHYHLAGDVELRNDELAAKIASILDLPISLDYVDFHKTRPGHDRRYALDNTKLSSLGWAPTYSFEEGLRNTLSYFMKHLVRS